MVVTRCGRPPRGRACAVRTFPFLLLPFFPLLIDRGGVWVGGGCSNARWHLASPILQSCVCCVLFERVKGKRSVGRSYRIVGVASGCNSSCFEKSRGFSIHPILDLTLIVSRSPMELRFFMLLPLVVFASASPCCAFVSSMQSRKKVFSSVQSQKKVFCYGDSLTAGTSPPLAPELFPYGPHLESELRRLVPYASPIVRWSGYPGWCATTMADPSTLDGSSGLRTFLRTISAKTGSPASLSVILAGTNDLAYESDSRPIVDAILALHRASHGEGVPTAAVGIPPSMWQRQSSDAANLAATVNKSLEGWCSSSEAKGMATFVECPIDISSVGNKLWSSDGLHFSPAGFKALGEGLAPSIAKIIQ